VPELRTGKRFPLQLPIRIEGQSPESALVGKTENLSASGAFISLGTELEIGSDVEFEMTIPAASIGAAQNVVVRCHGRVVRTGAETDSTQEAQPKSGVACVIESYEFIRAVQESGT